jgi:tRNA nucleotidyltransferase (CCA-adding enzyme)
MSAEGVRVDLQAPGEVRWIAERLEQAGFAAWAVGGAVRDALSGRSPGDWDLTTSARPRDVQRLFRRTVPIGIDHGTVGVIGRSGRMYEVTTFRRDVETFGRRARVSFSDSLEEDLERRDFTINAVAWHPGSGEVRDPHGGMRDLEERVLRTVGDPHARFEEDRLRVLRALRFAGRFGLRIDPGTWEAIRASAGKLGNLSAERIREELWKTMAGQPAPSATLGMYAESGVLSQLYPALEACRGVPHPSGGADLWEHLLATADAVPRTRPLLRIAGLLHEVGAAGPAAQLDRATSPAPGPSREESASAGRGGAGTGGGEAGVPEASPGAAVPAYGRGAAEERSQREVAGASAALARAILQGLRSSNADTDRVTHLIAQHRPAPTASASPAELRRWVRRVGLNHLNDVTRLLVAGCRAGDPAPPAAELVRLRGRLREVLAEKPPLAVSELAVGGADLRDLGVAPGPLYGEILKQLLERATEDPGLNTREALLDLARNLLERSS